MTPARGRLLLLRLRDSAPILTGSKPKRSFQIDWLAKLSTESGTAETHQEILGTSARICLLTCC